MIGIDDGPIDLEVLLSSDPTITDGMNEGLSLSPSADGTNDGRSLFLRIGNAEGVKDESVVGRVVSL